MRGPLWPVIGRAARSTSGRAGLLLLGFMAVVALAGPTLLPDPNAIPDAVAGATPPTSAHPFGTDHLNRDLLARVVHGARVSLLVASCAVVLAMVLGTAVGLIAGYAGGWIDALLMRFVDCVMAVPRLLILMLLIVVWDRLPLWALVLLLGGTGWLATSRLVRAEVLRLKHETFVTAAVALGASRRRVLLRHLLPNVAGPVLVTATLAAGDVIMLEASLSFLGLGIQPPTPSWGGMILEARPFLATAPWIGLFPGLAIVVTVLAANLLGEALHSALDPRLA